MTDYFGYDVHFVMNVTDIDDKVSHRPPYNTNDDLHILKIIVRARQNHLFSQFRHSATTLSADLLSQVSEAWGSYVMENVSKGLPDGEKPLRGEEEAKWPRIAELARDGSRKLECLKRDEKFDLHFTAAVRVFLVLSLAYIKIWQRRIEHLPLLKLRGKHCPPIRSVATQPSDSSMSLAIFLHPLSIRKSVLFMSFLSLAV
jgi:cysteinyl-tRNA synthetase